ncbi:hypothetical protein HN375_00735 [bacterium]|nr:hypothetical protein [bacterium]MBT3730361.1 hypothetical protein [bacterium]
MRYPWIALTILGIWLPIAVLILKEPRLDPTLLYSLGVFISVVLAMIGFRSSI